MSLAETVLKLQRIDTLLTGRQVNYVTPSFSNEQLITELEQVSQSLTFLDKLKNVVCRLQNSLTTLMNDDEGMSDQSNSEHSLNSLKLRTSQDVLQHLDHLVELINKQNATKKKSRELLKWCEEHACKLSGRTHVHDFLKSWIDGLSFASLLLYWQPDLFDKSTLKIPSDEVLCQAHALDNLRITFQHAKSVGIVCLLSPNDIVQNPNPTLIKMQVKEFYNVLKNPRPTVLPNQQSVPKQSSSPPKEESKKRANIEEKKKKVIVEQNDTFKKLVHERDSVADSDLFGDSDVISSVIPRDSNDDEEIYRRINEPRKARKPLPPITRLPPPPAYDSDEEDDDDPNFETSLLEHRPSKIKKQGYLYKWGNIVKNWKKRYFVFEESKNSTKDSTPEVYLSYYENGTKAKMLGTIPMNGACIRELDRGIYPRVKNAYHFSVEPSEKYQQKRIYVFEAECPEDRKSWITVMVSKEVGGVYAGVQKAKSSLRPLADSIKEGWLEKMGGQDKVDGWRIRYFVLRKNPDVMLYYYKTYGDAVKHSRKTERRSSSSRIFKRAPGLQTGGAISLQDGTFDLKIHHQVLLGKKFTFSIKPHDSSRRYLISAADEKDMFAWVQQISKTVLSGVKSRGSHTRVSQPPPRRKMLGKNDLAATSCPSHLTSTKYSALPLVSRLESPSSHLSSYETTQTTTSSSLTNPSSPTNRSFTTNRSPPPGDTIVSNPASSCLGSPDSLISGPSSNKRNSKLMDDNV